MTALQSARPSSPVAALVLLTLLVGVFWHHRVAVPRDQYEGDWSRSDRSDYSHPVSAMIHRELRQGKLPLWNPYQFAGQPLLATHAPALLYPPNLLLLAALPEEPALSLHAVLHLMLGGIFTWLFAARLGLKTGPRLSAAAVYVVGYPSVLGIAWPHILATQTWLPAILWATHGLVSEARLRWSLALASFIALAFLGGDAQGFRYEAEVGMAYGLFAFLFIASRGTRLRVLALATLAGLIAAGLAAPQILPTLELANQAIRGFEGLTLQQAAYGWLPYGQLVRGTLGPAFLAAAPAEYGAWSKHWLLVWPALALPLLPFGLLAKGQRAHWLFFGCAALLCGLFMTGPGSPVFVSRYALPLGDLFRLPMRMAFVYMFFVGMLLGVGLQGAIRLFERRSPAWVAAALAVLAVIATVIDLYARLDFPKHHGVIAPLSSRAPPELVEALEEAGDRRRAFLEVGAGHPRLVNKAGTLNGFFAVPDYEPMIPSDYQAYFDARDRGTGHIWHGHLSLAARKRERGGRELAAILDLMSVGYYVAPPGMMYALKPGRKLLAGTTRRRAGEFMVFARQSALPRAYTVACARPARDFDSSLKAITARAFHRRSEAILTVPGSEAPRGLAALAAACKHKRRSFGPATITSFANEEVTVTASCKTTCLLVLTDLFYPGWKATVDGEPAPLLRTNALFRGLILEPGTHRVVHRFESSSFRIGLVLCATATLASLLLVLAARSERFRFLS